METDIINDIFGDEKVTQSKPDAKQEDSKDDVEPDIQETNPEIEKLRQQIEKLTKQEADTKKWGNDNREVYMRAKKKTDELAKKLFEEGTIFDEEYAELSKVFDVSLDDEQPKSEEVSNSPIKKVVDDLKKTFDEFKKWSDEPDLDYKFNAFYKDLELVTDKRLNEIQEYMLSETDPKVLLKYVLDKGPKSFNKLYKPILEKGDALTYVESLLSENEQLKKELKELRFELDDTEKGVYTKSDKPSSYKSNKKDVVGDLFGI